MKLTDQVTSLELSKRLKELDVKQESLLYWNFVVSSSYEGEDDFATKREGWKLMNAPWEKGKSYSAFTVAELGEMLPMNVKLPYSNENGCWLETNKENGQWAVIYEGTPRVGTQPRNKVGGKILRREVASTEAEARGLMLEYLITSNLISL